MNSKVKIKKMTEEDLFSKDDSLRIRAKALDQCIDELEAVQQFYMDNPKFIIDGSLVFIVCLIDYLKELKTLKEKMQKLRERFEDFCAEECAICAMHTKDGCGLSEWQKEYITNKYMFYKANPNGRFVARGSVKIDNEPWLAFVFAAYEEE